MTADRPVLLCSEEFWRAYGGELLAIDPMLGFVPFADGGEMTPEELEPVTIAFFTPDLRPRRSAVFLATCSACPNLSWLQTDFAGIDNPVFGALLERGVRLSTGVGTTAPAIAQTVMLYLLALSRDLPRLFRAQAACQWEPAESTDLEGLALGIVGFGAIGHEVARLATAFGIDVVGLRRRPVPGDMYATWPEERFGDLLEWADAIVSCVPLTDATRGMFDARAFERMRPGSWFVNVGRGQTVDEPALAAALATGHLGGAALDVFAVEPLPIESALWAMPNVIITPHSSSATPSTARRAIELTIENFRRHAQGERLRNVVQPSSS